MVEVRQTRHWRSWSFLASYKESAITERLSVHSDPFNKMKLFILASCFTGFASGMAGQLSNVQNNRLQYDLATRLEHHRQILATIDQINKMSWYDRRAAIEGLQNIVRWLQQVYTIDDTNSQNQEANRRRLLNKNHQ